MNKKLKLILFDLDGTLIETVHEIADATNDTLRALDLDEVSESQVRDWIGHGTRELLISALACIKQCPIGQIREWSQLQQVFELFDHFYLARCGTHSYLYADVFDVLGQLKSAGIKMAVVTNKESRFTQAVIKAHHLESYFDVVISGDTLGSKKPDPQGINLCLQTLGVQPDEAIFIGDSSVDAKTAQNAGLRVWLMPYGYNMGAPLEDSKPNHIAKGFKEIAELLR